MPESYDGFISYSHAADDLLAPRLQAGLQRFAKPWWKRRALRVFRDESSLSANPHLWDSIAAALDGSGWFVLLLSPDAAESEWVNQEVSYWVEHKDPTRIMPVVTAGEFAWEGGDVVGSAVPDALRGVFESEPRWVEARRLGQPETLDLNNPEFAAVVADLAAPLRGVAKDELASEEVRQHKRTVRTAWAAGVVVLVLAVAAAVFGIQASNNAEEAELQAGIAAENAAEADRQARLAEENAAEADRQRGVAEESAEEADRQAAIAETNAAEADLNAQLAEARELAASAIGVLDDDPELATLLALEAIAASPPGVETPIELTNALWQAGSATRLIDVLDLGNGRGVLIDLSDDGSRLLVSSKDPPSLTMWDSHRLDEPLWEFLEETTDAFVFPTLSPDGRFVAVGVLDSESHEAQFDSDEEIEPDDFPNRVHVLTAESGQVVTTLAFPDCVGVDLTAFSHDGALLAVGSGWEGCPREGAESGQWVEIFDAETWESVKLHEMTDEAFGPRPVFLDDGRLFMFSQDPLQVFDADLADVQVFEQISGFGDVSSDGSHIAAFVWPERNDAMLFDGATGQQLDLLTPVAAFPRRPAGILFSPDRHGTYITIGTEGRQTHVFRVVTGNQDFSVSGGSADIALVDVPGNRLFTAHPDGFVKVWQLGASTFGIEPAGDLGTATWVNSNSFVIGETLGGLAPFDFDRFLEDGSAERRFFELSSGELTEHRLVSRGTEFVALGDQRFLYAPDAGHLFVADLTTGEEQYLIGCPIDPSETFCLDTGEPAPNHAAVISLDGSELATIEYREPDPESGESEELWTLIDPATLAVVSEESHPATGFVIGFDQDWIFRDDHDAVQTYATDRTTGEVIWTVDVSGRTEISPTGASVAVIGEGLTIIELATGNFEEIPVDLGTSTIRGIGFSPDESLIALGGEEALLIVDLDRGTISAQIPIPGVSDIYWLDAETMVIGSKNGVWGRISLDADELVASAQRNLVRSFTDQECLTYRIDPCPSLEEVRGRG